MRYVFKAIGDNDLPLIKNAKSADAQTIGDALAKIAEENGGRLTPRLAVAAARDESNPLHPCFEWDDAVAAEAYRLSQARAVIRLIRIESDGEEDGAPAFLSVADGAGISYRSLAAVSSSRELQLSILRAAERDLAAWERRYRELSDICKVVRQARETVARRRRDLSGDERPTAA
jgi:hypothetical protein